MHILANPNKLQIIGFIAISASELKNSPCVTIDYLLITPEYRGVLFHELGNLKASQYLLDYVINLATQVNADIPFRYIALQPAHEKLLPLYSSLGFEPLDNTGWLFFKINQ
ncbi:MAG: GNAT family N-acetyltransferase [Geobacter sp.]|nr:GNAT family N-acetyltransferase [Geobacter sp.]